MPTAKAATENCLSRFLGKRPHQIAAPVLILLSGILSLHPGGSAFGAEKARVPNVVLIVADDLGYGELGSYGQKKIRTPVLDRMANEGMRLTTHYAGNAVCATSRCVLMTGKHTGHAWIRNNAAVKPEGQKPIPAEEVTIAELFHDRGYATAACGKWGLGRMDSPGDPLSQGFDHFYGYNCQTHAHNYYPEFWWVDHQRVTLEGNTRGLTGEHYVPDLYADAALKFIEDNRDRPFFLFYPTIVPHLALQVPDDSLAEYQGAWSDPPYDGKHGYLPHPSPRAAYAAMITRMDRDVGRIFEKLKSLGLDENTIVVFTSDNGPTYDRLGGSDSDFFESAAGLRGLKGSLYDGGIRVPAIIRWPGHIAAGTVSDHCCAFYDWLPTLLDLSEATDRLPAGIDGISFAPTLLGQPQNQKEHEFLYWEFPAYGGQQAVRLGNWKAVRQNLISKAGKKAKAATFELYDLANDPAEEHDVAAQHPDVVQEIREIMAREHVVSTEFPFPALDTP
jgi:arylsulfatase